MHTCTVVLRCTILALRAKRIKVIMHMNKSIAREYHSFNDHGKDLQELGYG